MSDIQQIYDKLSNFISVDASQYNKPEKLQEAIEKMIFLSEQQFSDLLEDILEEIARRKDGKQEKFLIKGMHSQRRTKSRQKLSCLGDEKFESLVIDVFLVFCHKNKLDNKIENKNTDEIENLIEELEVIIKNMKNIENKDEIILEKLKSERKIEDKFLHYNEYVRNIFSKNQIDTEVVDYIEFIFDGWSKECSHDKFYDYLPETLLKNADKMILNNEEYKYHRNKILELQNMEQIEHKTKKRLINKEMTCIYFLLLEEVDLIEAKNNLHNIDKEVEIIIYNLDILKNVMEYDKKEEYPKIANSVYQATSNILQKINTCTTIEEDLKSKIKSENQSLKNFEIDQNFDKLPDKIFNLASYIKNVLYCLPTCQF